MRLTRPPRTHPPCCSQVSGGGDCLVYMATDASVAGRSGVYYNNDLDGKGGHRFEEQPPSAEAQSDEEAARLWALSAQLVGLPQTA